MFLGFLARFREVLEALGSLCGVSYVKNVHVALATSVFSKGALEGHCVRFQAPGQLIYENVVVAKPETHFPNALERILGVQGGKCCFHCSEKHTLGAPKLLRVSANWPGRGGLVERVRWIIMGHVTSPVIHLRG